MCRTCDSQSREAQQSRDTIQGHPTGMAPMPVPPTLDKQDAPMAPITPSLCNQMLQQPPTLPEAPWHLWQGGGLPTPKGGNESSQASQPAAGSMGCQESWPLCAALEDDLRCGTFRAALPGSPWLPGLPHCTRQPGSRRLASHGANRQSQQLFPAAGTLFKSPENSLPCKMRPTLPCARTVNALGTVHQHRTWGRDRQPRHCYPPGQFPGPSLSALSHGCHSLLQKKDAVFTRAGHGGHEGHLGTVPLHGLSHLDQGQTQA